MTRLRRWICCAAIVAATMAAFDRPPVLTAAQGQPGEFRPVSPAELDQERLPATPFVFTAYAFVWIALLVYVIVLWRRIGRIEHELADVRARLQPDKRR